MKRALIHYKSPLIPVLNCCIAPLLIKGKPEAVADKLEMAPPRRQRSGGQQPYAFLYEFPERNAERPKSNKATTANTATRFALPTNMSGNTVFRFVITDTEASVKPGPYPFVNTLFDAR